MTDLTALPPPPDDLVAGRASLFLDFDGTLVEIAARHDGVVVHDTVRGLVRALARRLDGRLAVVSGRPAGDILGYLCPDGEQPGFAIAGSHGLELRRADGRTALPPRPEGLDTTIADLRAFAAPRPGVVIEEKPFGVAIHYRQAPDAAAAADAIAEAAARASGLALQRGKMVCELRAGGADKGDAVRALMAEAPMAGTRPIFLGDDLTDEAGFRAVAAAGGAGILIGDRPGPTAARYALPDVSAVHHWLGAIAGVSA